MDLEPTKNANIGITTQSVASIDLDASPYRPPPPTEWVIEEQQREYERKSRDKASRWLNRQDSSRPAPGAIINSLPLDERMRHNGEIVGLVDTVLLQPSHSDASKPKPSSIQAPTALSFAARRNHDGNTFQDRLLGSNAAFQTPEHTPSFSDRNSEYHDTGHHDEGRPPDPFSSDRWHANLSLQTTPPTRGVKEEHSPHPGLHQVHWASTNPSETDTCSITRKQPKRQNSRLTDDEQGARRRQKRHRTGRRPRTSPAVPGPANSSRQAANRIPQTVPGRSRQQTQREPQSHPDPGPSNSSSFQDGRVECNSDCQFSEKNFVGSEETCFFWLHNNAKYSTSGRTACQGRKIEISHIVTHAVDHHGLIRGRDPRYGNRAYLMSCQLHDPGTKGTGNCATCKSLHEWGDADFDDPEHHGTTLCLRCWCGFTKREMKEHLAGPLCSYMAEQPKSTKVYILYTTFCSKDDPPSAPPNFDTPSHGRRPPKGRNRSAARESQPKQQGRNQRTGQQTPQESSNGNQFRSLQPTGKSNKPTTPRRPGALHLEVPAQNPPRLSIPAQRPPSQSSLSLSPSWRQTATRSFQSQSPFPEEIYRQVRQEMSPGDNSLALSIPMRQSRSHGQSFQSTNMQQSLSDSHSPLRQPAQSAHQSPTHEVSQQFDNQSLQELLQSIDNQRGPNPLAQLVYQDLNSQQLFGNLMYTGNLQESGVPRIQTTPIDEFNTTLPFETSFFQPTPSQATASQVPSTLGEPLPIPSPDMDEPRWLLPDPDDDDDDPFQYIGSNPALQESVGRQDAPVRQQTLRPQNSSLNGLLQPSQQVKIEQDSAYESMGQANTEPDDSLNAMYRSAEPDNMEIDEGLGTDLGRYFDFERYEETSFTDPRFL